MTSDPGRPSSQAETMLRRVSPEGRARAMKEQRRRQRAQARLIGQCLLAGLAIVVAMVLIGSLAGPLNSVEVIAALVLFVLACAGIAYRSRERPLATNQLTATPLVALPKQTATWLEQNRLALPAPAVRLVDDIGVRLEALAPQLAKLDPREPAADAVRKLVGVELPGLVERYRDIPESLRSGNRESTGSPDATLLHGLGIVDSEIARMTEQLARGAFDDLATQNRFLELKYDEDDLGN